MAIEFWFDGSALIFSVELEGSPVANAAATKRAQEMAPGALDRARSRGRARIPKKAVLRARWSCPPSAVRSRLDDRPHDLRRAAHVQTIPPPSEVALACGLW